MDAAKFLVVGRHGQVGWELCRALAPLGAVTAVDYPEIDLADADSIRQVVRASRPRVLLNAAAYTAVDQAESEPGLCQAINGVAPGILAEEARRLGAILVHYSTDYVFDGTSTRAYHEDDPPQPLGAYGRSKLAGDAAVLALGGAHLIFRLCWVYGARGQNFLRTIVRLARERETLRVVNDQIGCPTWSRMIAQATALALQRVLGADDPSAFNGIYNLAASGQASWHGFASRIVDLMPAAHRRCQRVEAIPTTAYPTPARRPAFSVLDTAKLQRVFGLRLPDWAAGLALVMEELNFQPWPAPSPLP